jgi:alpha-L-rhamnosidase
MTFGDHALAKRCLYIFAATPFLSNGLLSASAYEKPEILSGGQSIRDFTQIYAAALRDYVVASGDKETGLELFDVAKRQFELSLKQVNGDGCYVMNDRDPQERDDSGEKLWHFIDCKPAIIRKWRGIADFSDGIGQPTLEKTTASHCVVVFGLRALLDLSKHLSLPTPVLSVPFSPNPQPLDEIITHLTLAARKHLYNPALGTFTSGPSTQISWASNAWAIVASIPESEDMAAKALQVAYTHPESIKANTPYLHHYLVEAMIKAGLHDLAREHILGYWGSMIDAGAETFWEAWDPERPRFSPYGDFHSNS